MFLFGVQGSQVSQFFLKKLLTGLLPNILMFNGGEKRAKVQEKRRNYKKDPNEDFRTPKQRRQTGKVIGKFSLSHLAPALHYSLSLFIDLAISIIGDLC